ncbi:MAG: hypothetical protein ACI4SB_10165 [Acutalibacteraceae bacterium]
MLTVTASLPEHNKPTDVKVQESTDLYTNRKGAVANHQNEE